MMGLARKIKTAASVFHGGNFKNLLALPSITPKQGGDKLGSDGLKSARSLAVLGASISGLLGCATVSYSDEREHGLVCPCYPWSGQGILSSYDQASISRGQAVYQQSCASCHTHLSRVGVSCSKEETKAMASEIEVVENSKDKGETFSCSGKPTNCFPQSYTNEQAVRFANRGGSSVDLSLIAKASHNSRSYVYTLLSSYHSPNNASPWKRTYCNPYLSKGALDMPKMPHAEIYKDCGQRTISQMGRDIMTSLV